MLDYPDHDQRFKTIIREFFGDFLLLFFGDWAARFDLTSVEWLDREIMSNPPEGPLHRLDLLARLRTLTPVQANPADPSEWLALIHIEVESPDKTTLVKQRLPGYFVHLMDQYQLPVLPIVVYLRVGLDGVGIDRISVQFWELETLTFQYLYVGLPGLNAEEYVRGENWLGVALAALMKIPPDRVAWLGAEALRRLSESPLPEQKRYLLAECVQAYLPLEDSQRAEYERIIMGEPYSGVRAMNETVFEKGLRQGLDQGLRQGLDQGLQQGLDQGLRQGLDQGLRQGTLTVIQAILESKFKSLPPGVMDRVGLMSDDQIHQLAIAIPAAETLADLGL